jgi:hypothetical protein
MNKQKVNNLIELSCTVVKVGLLILRLRALGISHKAISFLLEGLDMATKEVENEARTLQFKTIVKNLERENEETNNSDN